MARARAVCGCGLVSRTVIGSRPPWLLDCGRPGSARPMYSKARSMAGVFALTWSRCWRRHWRPATLSCSTVSGASAPSRLALDGSGCFGGPAPRQQFAETTVGPVIDELGQHVGQVSMRIDAMRFAGLNQGGEHRPVFCPFIRTGEECVFSVESDRAHAALDGIGVDLDAAVLEEAQQPVPLIEAIADGLGDR